MSDRTTCPQEEELLPEAVGEALSPEVSLHVQDCQRCQERVRRLRVEIENLRSVSAANAGDTPAMAETTTWKPAQDAPTVEECPALIGKYRVLGQLSQGGQAVVYRVTDPTLQRDLVAKVARQRPHLEAAGRERLIAEGRLLARIDHPNVVRVVDLDFHEDRPFLVMEYVRGRTLRQYVGSRRLPPKEAARLLAEVARAVAAAHALGITHQDLKPENILIDEAGRPRIIDFGLAKLCQAWQAPGDEAALVGGTAWYMAPEQARGELERVGPQTDIFGLGAVLFELLTGHAPFEHRDRKEALHRAEGCRFDPQPLGSRGVPRRLAAICRRAMQPDPADRYPSAEALAGELERAGRSRARLPLALAAAAVILIGLVLIGVRERRLPSSARPAARLPLQRLVHVLRDGRAPVWIDDAVPAIPDLPFRIECEVPSGLAAAVFWYDTEGNLQEMEIKKREALPDGSGTRLVGPDMAFDDKSGMEFIVACGSAQGRPAFEDVKAILQEVLGLPTALNLSATTIALLTRDEVKIEDAGGPSRGARPVASPTLTTQLEDRFDAVRRRLAARYEFVAAVAFRHESSPPGK
jgi:tRNA A-37 threonylcarbamoyl transferase component Bud32